jgi:hypothetical protein
MHIESGENPRGVGLPEGRIQGANGGQGELVYEQPGIEVDDSCHSWREPSKQKGRTARGIQQGELCHVQSCIVTRVR